MLIRCLSVVFICASVGGCASTGTPESLFGFDVRNETKLSVAVRLVDPTARHDMTENIVVLGPLGEYRHATIYTPDSSVIVQRWERDEEVGTKLSVPIAPNANVRVVVGFRDGELIFESVETAPWEW